MCTRLDRFRSDDVREVLNIFAVHQRIQENTEQMETTLLHFQDEREQDPEGRHHLPVFKTAEALGDLGRDSHLEFRHRSMDRSLPLIGKKKKKKIFSSFYLICLSGVQIYSHN